MSFPQPDVHKLYIYSLSSQNLHPVNSLSRKFGFTCLFNTRSHSSGESRTSRKHREALSSGSFDCNVPIWVALNVESLRHTIISQKFHAPFFKISFYRYQSRFRLDFIDYHLTQHFTFSHSMFLIISFSKLSKLQPRVSMLKNFYIRSWDQCVNIQLPTFQNVQLLSR